MLSHKYHEQEYTPAKDTITATISLDELKVKNHYLHGTLVATVIYNQAAETESGYSYYPIAVTDISGLEYVNDAGYDSPASELNITSADVLSYLQAYAERFEDNLNNDNVREI